MTQGPRRLKPIVLSLMLCCSSAVVAQEHSVARLWNEALLNAIRDDFARPTVHARNLFHTSAAMYDAWAAYDDLAGTYLLGNAIRGFACPYTKPSTPPDDIEASREEAISFAAYRLLRHRFRNSPNASRTLARLDSLIESLGYDASNTLASHASASPAELGNYIALCLIGFGLQDGSNEQLGYENVSYTPVNPPLAPVLPGNPDLTDLNRWQPLTLRVFIDQSGNVIPITTIGFLSPEWGRVVPFSLDDSDRIGYERDDFLYWVYHDPGSPPLIETVDTLGIEDPYKWGFALVAAWSSHLDPSDGVMWDISPSSLGNNSDPPSDFEDYPSFYDFADGGDASRGHAQNPITGLPYEPQLVPRGDYTRVLAEFWADGPDSETPPGHWFTILNYVIDHPEGHRRLRGEGPELHALEWDVKAYFALGGAMHDAAIAAWGIKGWYDYIRPVSAIRAMADRGQSTNPDDSTFSTSGIPLVEGLIEIVTAEDTLAGDSLQHVGKVKVRAWRGPSYVNDPDTSVAGVGWILAENWWPYQRPTFVTPPFAGYVSGHSTYSRAAAEVLELLTGDPFFPGGMGEFHAPKNAFLVFEDGPSVDVTLQWATYRDASDQTSLSRIWGGIHPPADDLPGRRIGAVIGRDAFQYAERFFSGLATSSRPPAMAETRRFSIYPNPVSRGEALTVDVSSFAGKVKITVMDVIGRIVDRSDLGAEGLVRYRPTSLPGGVYFLRIEQDGRYDTAKFVVR